MPSQPIAAVGYRVHTGWAAAVVLAADLNILERRRVAYEPNEQATRFVYHRAAEGPPELAQTLLATARADAVNAAKREVGMLLEAVRDKGFVVRRAAVPAGNSKLPDRLSDILASHSRVHAAEGVFYRETLGEACSALGLRVIHPPERDLWPLAAGALDCSTEALRTRFQQMTRALGPPWGEDQKLAALGAAAALAAGQKP